MYLTYYHLKKEPFNITPDPDLLFLSPSHKEALAAAIYGVTQRKGFVAIIGEVGVGKTTIVRSFLERMKGQNLKIIYLFNADVSFNSLLKKIYQGLDIDPLSDDAFEMVNQLHGALNKLFEGGTNVVVIIDEAQNLPEETLKSLHMLSNIETSTQKLIQVVLSGQPELEQKLNSERLRQIKQRIVIKVRILPLSKQESLAYINHRLTKTARKNSDLFSATALKAIVDSADGIPRIINTLCDNCLITSYGRHQPRVTARVAREIVAELRGKRRYSLGWQHALLASGMVCAALAAAFLFQSVHSTTKTLAVPSGVTASVPKGEAANEDALRQSAGSPGRDGRSNEPEETATERVAAPDGAGALQRAEGRHKWTVKKGDTLAKLLLERYGFVDKKLIDRVKRRNPHIINENVIQEGASIYLPPLR